MLEEINQLLTEIVAFSFFIHLCWYQAQMNQRSWILAKSFHLKILGWNSSDNTSLMVRGPRAHPLQRHNAYKIQDTFIYSDFCPTFPSMVWKYYYRVRGPTHQLRASDKWMMVTIYGLWLQGPSSKNVVVTIPSLRQTRGNYPQQQGPPHRLGRHMVTIYRALDVVSNVAYLYCSICMNLEGRGGQGRQNLLIN